MEINYLKAPSPMDMGVTDELRTRVSEILRDIEINGLDAVRRYSRKFDDWAPSDFVVGDAEFERAASGLDDAMRGHITFAQNQIRTFAQAQRATMSNLEVEVGDGCCSGTRTSRSMRWAPTYRGGATRCSRLRS